MKKVLLTLFSFFFVLSGAWADLPFRNHRYNGFAVLQTNSESIVFVGNSITNMHEWWEAFGNTNVLNRGVSGAVTDEMFENLESVLEGKPKKIFFMMGTNDLGTQGMNTPSYVARNVRKILNRCKKESPTTEVYVQSILPSNIGLRTLANQQAANDSIKKICGETGATYIDLWNDFIGIPNGVNTLDKLHLTAAGYRVWCKKVAPYVGSDCIYLDSSADNACSLGGAHGERCTYFGFMPVKADDILMIGDGTINGGEWHELLHSDKVKTRASGWAVPGADIATMQKMLPNIFKGRSDNAEPKEVYIQLGYSEASGKTAATTIAASYKTFVQKVREYAPNTKIYVCAVYPSNTADINTSYIVPLNTAIQTMAQSMTNVTFVPETYTELAKNGVANTDYFTGVYLYGKGYAKYSQILAKYMGDAVTATTDAEAEARLARFNARKALASAISTMEDVSIGTGVGQYTEENASALTTAIDRAYQLLANGTATTDEMSAEATSLNAALTEVLPTINLPLTSENGTEHWYQLYTPNRGSYYMTSQGVGENVLGAENTGYARTMWKFVRRTDGSYDIVNRKDASYISPASSFNTAIATSETQPSKGWTLSYSNTPGLFIISSGNVQLNQTNSPQNYLIYNWSSGQSGTDRNDTGCQFCITAAPEPTEEPLPFTEGDITISLSTGVYANPSATFNSTWTSTTTDPKLTFKTPGANNMAKNGTDIVIYTGTAKKCVYTLTVSSGYYITGYTFDFVNGSGNTSSITLTSDDVNYTTSATTQTLKKENIQTESISFTISGDNKPIVLKNFVVSLINKSYATGIAEATTVAPSSDKANNHSVYDLSRRKVSSKQQNKLTRGIYIVDGKKVIR